MNSNTATNTDSTTNDGMEQWKGDCLERLPRHHPAHLLSDGTDVTVLSKRLLVMGRVAPMPTSTTAHITDSARLQRQLDVAGPEVCKHLLLVYVGPREEFPRDPVYAGLAGVCMLSVNKHCMLPIKRLFKASQAMAGWLSLHPDNQCLVQCSTGVARSGLLISAFLRHHDLMPDCLQAMQWFMHRRSATDTDYRLVHDQYRRYLKYFDDTCLLSGRVPSRTPIRLHQVVVHTVPNFDGAGGCSPAVSVFRNGRLLFDSASSVHMPSGFRVYLDTHYMVFWFDQLLLYQDILIRVAHINNHHDTTIFTHAFNTGYVLPGIIRMLPSDLYMPLRTVPPPGQPTRARFSNKFMVDMMLAEVGNVKEYYEHAVVYEDVKRTGLADSLRSLARSSSGGRLRDTEDQQSSDDDDEHITAQKTRGPELVKQVAHKLNTDPDDVMRHFKARPSMQHALQQDLHSAADSDTEEPYRSHDDLQSSRTPSPMPGVYASDTDTDTDSDTDTAQRKHAISPVDRHGEAVKAGRDAAAETPTASASAGASEDEHVDPLSGLTMTPGRYNRSAGDREGDRGRGSSGAGQGGSGPGLGPGQGQGMGPGYGEGMGPGQGAGQGQGMGPGKGEGMGPGYGPGKGPGHGEGMGPGYGEGMGTGQGSGMGPGQGSGMGPGQGSGMGPGQGSGMGPGQGSGMGTGDQSQPQPDQESQRQRQPQRRPGSTPTQPPHPDSYPDDDHDMDMDMEQDGGRGGRGGYGDEHGHKMAGRRPAPPKQPTSKDQADDDQHDGDHEIDGDGSGTAKRPPHAAIGDQTGDHDEEEEPPQLAPSQPRQPQKQPQPQQPQPPTPSARQPEQDQEQEPMDNVPLAAPKPKKPSPIPRHDQQDDDDEGGEEDGKAASERQRRPRPPQDDYSDDDLVGGAPRKRREPQEAAAEDEQIGGESPKPQPPPVEDTQPPQAPPQAPQVTVSSPPSQEQEPPAPMAKPPPPPPPPAPPLPTPSPPLIDDPNRIKVKHGFHWSDIRDKSDLAGTMWADMDGQEDLDVHRFQDLFCVDPRNDKRRFGRLGGQGDGSSSPTPSTTPAVIDMRRAQNIGIGMSRFYKRHTNDDIRDRIAAHQDDAFSLDDLYALRDIMPTAGEQKVFSEYEGPREVLVPAEQFLQDMSKEPGITWMTESMLLEKAFDADLRHSTEKIETTAKLLNKLCDSKDLKRVMKTTLDLGNLTNYDYGRAVQRHKAHGFRVDSLPNLKDVWAVDRESNLTHYLSRLLERKAPEALDIHRQFPELRKAKGFELKTFVKNVDSLKAQVEAVKEGRGAPDTPATHHFRQAMQPFLAHATTQLDHADRAVRDYQQAWSRALQYFGEKDANMKPEDLFGHFDAFLTDLDTATKQLRERKVKLAKAPSVLRASDSLTSLTE